MSITSIPLSNLCHHNVWGLSTPIHHLLKERSGRLVASLLLREGTFTCITLFIIYYNVMDQPNPAGKLRYPWGDNERQWIEVALENENTNRWWLNKLFHLFNFGKSVEFSYLVAPDDNDCDFFDVQISICTGRESDKWTSYCVRIRLCGLVNNAEL